MFCFGDETSCFEDAAAVVEDGAKAAENAEHVGAGALSFATGSPKVYECLLWSQKLSAVTVVCRPLCTPT